MRFQKKEKIAPQYVAPFDILEQIDSVAYRLTLHPQLSQVHNMFYVSMFKIYVPN